MPVLAITCARTLGGVGIRMHRCLYTKALERAIEQADGKGGLLREPRQRARTMLT